MAHDLQVFCINKTPRMDAHDRIKRIGGFNADGNRWSLSQPEAIAGIEAGTWTFHVSAAGRVVRVIIAVSPFGHKYLKTQNDGVQPDNLLSLPECP